MPKWLPKVIADAERHRRTPRTLATWSKAVESEILERTSDASTEKAWKNMSKTWKYHQNGSQNRSKIDEKSRLRRGCVFGAFWGGLGAPRGGRALNMSRSLWRPFSTKNRKKCIQKGIPKSMPKKYRTIMPKGSKWHQNGCQNQWFVFLVLERRKRTKLFKLRYETWFGACKK